jgi:glycosyltransferase involved in cell wall biosynthesis
MNISVVLPTYNEAEWLGLTLEKIDQAIVNAAGLKKSEIIIVDDGSSDNTGHVLKSLRLKTKVIYLKQKNKGRFVARENGVKRAHYDHILFIDSRVHIENNAIDYIVKKMSLDNTKVLWNAHVIVAKTGNIYARFWDAIVFIAWRKYFVDPRDISYGISDFDKYPKGTTCFLAPKAWVLEATNAFETTSKNMKFANDDTLLIRSLIQKADINLSPQFSCVYHSRSSLKKFLKHAYHRGNVFVDGFLRRDGNRYFWPLLLFLILSILIPALLIASPMFMGATLGLIVGLWILELFVALLLSVVLKDALSLFILTPFFVLFYGAGIWTATVKRVKT